MERREFLQLAALVTGHYALDPSASASVTEEDLTEFVRISTGTGGHGHTFPGATVPFGAVQLSPDTEPGSGIGAPGITTATVRSWGSVIPT